jgi:biopolymer transport protein ExbD
MAIPSTKIPPLNTKPYEVSVKAFPELQLMCVSLKGIIDSEACHELIQKVTENLTKLSPGFAYLNDMTLVKEMKNDTYQLHIEVMEIIREKGVKKVARVFGEKRNDIGFNLASKFHYDHNVIAAEYTTITEALSALIS